MHKIYQVLFQSCVWYMTDLYGNITDLDGKSAIYILLTVDL